MARGPLTWRGVQAPSFGEANRLMEGAMSRFAGGFTGLGEVGNQINDQQVEKGSQIALANMSKFTDSSDWAAALASGSHLGGVAPGYVSQQALGLVDRKRSNLLGDDSTMLGMDKMRQDMDLALRADARAERSLALQASRAGGGGRGSGGGGERGEPVYDENGNFTGYSGSGSGSGKGSTKGGSVKMDPYMTAEASLLASDAALIGAAGDPLSGAVLSTEAARALAIAGQYGSSGKAAEQRTELGTAAMGMEMGKNNSAGLSNALNFGRELPTTETYLPGLEMGNTNAAVALGIGTPYQRGEAAIPDYVQGNDVRPEAVTGPIRGALPSAAASLDFNRSGAGLSLGQEVAPSAPVSETVAGGAKRVTVPSSSGSTPEAPAALGARGDSRFPAPGVVPLDQTVGERPRLSFGANVPAADPGIMRMDSDPNVSDAFTRERDLSPRFQIEQDLRTQEEELAGFQERMANPQAYVGEFSPAMLPGFNPNDPEQAAALEYWNNLPINEQAADAMAYWEGEASRIQGQVDEGRSAQAQDLAIAQQNWDWENGALSYDRHQMVGRKIQDDRDAIQFARETDPVLKLGTSMTSYESIWRGEGSPNDKLNNLSAEIAKKASGILPGEAGEASPEVSYNIRQAILSVAADAKIPEWQAAAVVDMAVSKDISLWGVRDFFRNNFTNGQQFLDETLMGEIGQDAAFGDLARQAVEKARVFDDSVRGFEKAASDYTRFINGDTKTDEDGKETITTAGVKHTGFDPTTSAYKGAHEAAFNIMTGANVADILAGNDVGVRRPTAASEAVAPVSSEERMPAWTSFRGGNSPEQARDREIAQMNREAEITAQGNEAQWNPERFQVNAMIENNISSGSPMAEYSLDMLPTLIARGQLTPEMSDWFAKSEVGKEALFQNMRDAEQSGANVDVPTKLSKEFREYKAANPSDVDLTGIELSGLELSRTQMQTALADPGVQRSLKVWRDNRSSMPWLFGENEFNVTNIRNAMRKAVNENVD